MHEVREACFECEFFSGSCRRVARVHAWDAKEACQLFVTELRADGIEDAGEVVVSPIRGGLPSRARVPRGRAA
jgi:hypothetical protein